MRKLFLSLVFLTFQSICLYSQDTIFVLHPALGDTIDQQEKKDFLLFPEIKNKDFNYGLIIKSAEQYMLNLWLVNDSLFNRPIEQAEITKITEGIDKLLVYYSKEAKADSMKTSKDNQQPTYHLNPENTPTIVIDQETKRNAGIEGRRKQQLKQRGIDAGLRGQDLQDYQSTGGYGEIRFKKKKK